MYHLSDREKTFGKITDEVQRERVVNHTTSLYRKNTLPLISFCCTTAVLLYCKSAHNVVRNHLELYQILHNTELIVIKTVVGLFLLTMHACLSEAVRIITNAG